MKTSNLAATGTGCLDIISLSADETGDLGRDQILKDFTYSIIDLAFYPESNGESCKDFSLKTPFPDNYYYLTCKEFYSREKVGWQHLLKIIGGNFLVSWLPEAVTNS